LYVYDPRCDDDIIPENVFENGNIKEPLVSPNPVSNGDFLVSFPQITKGDWVLLDMIGRATKRGTINEQLDMVINMREEKKGMYFLKVTSGSNIYFTKIIVE